MNDSKLPMGPPLQRQNSAHARQDSPSSNRKVLRQLCETTGTRSEILSTLLATQNPEVQTEIHLKNSAKMLLAVLKKLKFGIFS